MVSVQTLMESLSTCEAQVYEALLWSKHNLDHSQHTWIDKSLYYIVVRTPHEKTLKVFPVPLSPILKILKTFKVEWHLLNLNRDIISDSFKHFKCLTCGR